MGGSLYRLTRLERQHDLSPFVEILNMFAFGWLWGIVGIILLLIGGFLVLFFPATVEHQETEFFISGPVIGFVLLIIGGVLVFM